MVWAPRPRDTAMCPELQASTGILVGSKGCSMSRGFRLTLQLIATLATAAAVARATEPARQAFLQPAAEPPRHRADAAHPAVTTAPADPPPHPFGPTLAVPCRGVESPTSDVIELEASGELDDGPSPTERLLARRHAAEAS